MATVVLWPRLVSKRVNFGGAGYIAGELPGGLVTVNGAPGGREVEVRHFVTRYLLAVTFSNPDGTYRVDDVDPAEEFEAIGRDWARVYNSVIATRIRPKPY